MHSPYQQQYDSRLDLEQEVLRLNKRIKQLEDYVDRISPIIPELIKARYTQRDDLK